MSKYGLKGRFPVTNAQMIDTLLVFSTLRDYVKLDSPKIRGKFLQT